ncbi:MAG: hypothetical protein JWP68_3545 [Modestobacter sp.]|nr:hypothetical protein [Modestobacter sp.]
MPWAGVDVVVVRGGVGTCADGVPVVGAGRLVGASAGALDRVGALEVGALEVGEAWAVGAAAGWEAVAGEDGVSG